jgi:hypothetical protein
MEASHAALEDLAAISLQSTAALRPSPSIRGRIHYATDTGSFSYDTGSAWVAIQNVLTYGSPSAETIGASASDGVSASIARADHVHAMPGFGAVTSAITYGIAAANGTATTVARSDHTHGSPSLGSTAATTSAVGDAAAVGVGTTPARSDHVHGREGFGAVTAATSFGQASANGTAVTVARSDHTHGSPSLSGVAATTSAVGDAAAIGSATTAAKADHVHGREAFGAVTAQTAFGASSANGTATTVAHSDHTHGTPATPVTSWAGRTGAVTATAADIGAGTFPTGTFNFPGTLQEGGNRVYSSGNVPPYPVTSVATRTGAVTLTAADIAAGTFPAGTFAFTGNVTVGGTLDTTGNLSEAGSRVYSAGNPPPYPVSSVAGRTGAVTLTAADIAAGSFPGNFAISGTLSVNSGLTLQSSAAPSAPASLNAVLYANTNRVYMKDNSGAVWDVANTKGTKAGATVISSVATTAATTTTFLSFTSLQAGTYLFEFTGSAGISATTAGIRAAINFTGTTTELHAEIEAFNAASSPYGEAVVSNNTFALSGMSNWGTANLVYPVRVFGQVVVTAAGDLQFRFGPSATANLTMRGRASLTRIA